MHFFQPERPTKAHGWYQASLPFLLFPRYTNVRSHARGRPGLNCAKARM